MHARTNPTHSVLQHNLDRNSATELWDCSYSITITAPLLAIASVTGSTFLRDFSKLRVAGTDFQSGIEIAYTLGSLTMRANPDDPHGQEENNRG